MLRKRQSAENQYPVREQKLLAIVLALKQWFHLVRGPQQVHVQTDHESLRYLKTCPQPMTPQQAPRSQFSEEYNLTLWHVLGLDNPAADACSRLTSQQFMDIKNATRSQAFVVPLVESWVSPEGQPVDEFLHVLEDSFSHDEVWPQPYHNLYVSLPSARSLGKDPDVDVDPVPDLRFDTEPAAEPEKLEPLPSDGALADNSHEPVAHLNYAGNEVPDMLADTDDLPEVDTDRPPSSHLWQRTLICPDLDGADSLSMPPRRYTTASSLAQGWAKHTIPFES